MKERGFSLIEIVIVLVLISLSISLVAPSLSRFSKAVELKAAAQKISGILRFYRSEAIQKGKVHQILFDPQLREVRIQPVADNGERLAEKKYLLPYGIQIKGIDVPSPLYPSEFPAIEFYPNGSSNGGSILLNNQDQKRYRIKVHFLTGMVAVEEA